MRCALLMSALLGVLAAGCRGYTPETGVIVTGKILKAGQPLVVPNAASGEGYVAMQLAPLFSQADGTPPEGSNGTYKSDGTVRFEYAGRGIKPGKYRLVIEAHDGSADLLGGRFGFDQSAIEISVPAAKLGGAYDFGTIDLDSPASTRP